jgi:EAL domain-containing protein (putative c-di-GMP-specific phosphodiesterase class I)
VAEKAHQRALLLDDDPLILRAYSRAIAEAGFEVRTSTNGQDALVALREKPFDVIVSDISMPGMTGTEFLKAVRQIDMDVPVILVTGAPALETAVQAVGDGAFRYLMKPVEVQTLEDTVRRAAQLHGLARLKRQALELVGDEAHQLGDQATLELRFEHALETLWMAFQPIVAPMEKRLYGFEALLRNEEQTLMRPDLFLLAAERLGRLTDLGRTIRRAVAVAAATAPPDVNLFVNLHPADLVDEDLHSPTAPLSTMAKRVVLEVTERAALHSVRDVEARIASLRRLGFRIAVDDLGAGYAGLSSFAQLEPEVVKLDMSLARGVDANPTKQGVIRSMAGLCREMGMLVITEGVETVAERDTLLQLGCLLFQGYLFGKPGRPFPTALM